MLYYFTFPNFWNTHMLKTYPSYKVNWDHKMSISVSNELNQTGTLGKHLAHIKRLKFLGRVTMIGFLFLFSTPQSHLLRKVSEIWEFGWTMRCKGWGSSHEKVQTHMNSPLRNTHQTSGQLINITDGYYSNWAAHHTKLFNILWSQIIRN